MTKMSFGDQLPDSLVHKSFRNHPFFTAVWKLWTAFFDRLTVEAGINQSMSTRGEL